MLVAFNSSLDVNAALLVDRLAGLRGEEQLFPDGDAPAGSPFFVGRRLRDVDRRVWQEISLARLVRHEAFLKIVG
jgi:twitching motility protein PilI